MKPIVLYSLTGVKYIIPIIKTSALRMERMSDDIILTREPLIDVSYADGFADGVKEERERCARIAEQFDRERGTEYGQLGDAAEWIANRIRNGQ